MIEIIDFGCNEHNWRQLTLIDPKQTWSKILFIIFQEMGEYHTYICSHGNTHRIREFKMSYVIPAPAYEKILS